MKLINLYELEGMIIGDGINEREIKLYASPESDISRENFALGLTIIKPGQVHETHSHIGNQEIIYVNKGDGIAIVENYKGTHEFRIRENHILSLDYNEAHSFINDGKEDLELLWIYSPSGVADEKFLIRTQK
jgi:mannose-6-phosphate isomerase-like protein (cupin superfamily)